MPTRDWLFDRQGRYVVDKPTGWSWGDGELDSTRFILLRKNLGAEGGEVRRRKKGIDPGSLTGRLERNIYTGAIVVALAAREQYVVGARFLNLRTGAVTVNLGAASPGDLLFAHKRMDTEDELTGRLLLVKDLSPLRVRSLGNMTLKEAQAWR